MWPPEVQRALATCSPIAWGRWWQSRRRSGGTWGHFRSCRGCHVLPQEVKRVLGNLFADRVCLLLA